MARSMWSGSISFGLVNIPVRLFTAVSPKEVRFNQLHDADGGRIQLKRVCTVDGEEVPYEHIAKGYEISKGRYVKLSQKELEALTPEASRAIAIQDFVDLGQIDPVYYESTYYLAPEKGAERSYRLLYEAMKRTNKVGIAQMVMRTKEYLCAVRPLGRALAVSTMQHADEIVPEEQIEDLPPETMAPGERELAMAEQLVQSLASEWMPDKYKDAHRERVLDLVTRKAEGEEIVAQPPLPERPGRVVSLMEALQRSLEMDREASKPQARGEIRHRAQAARRARKSAGPAKARKPKER